MEFQFPINIDCKGRRVKIICPLEKKLRYTFCFWKGIRHGKKINPENSLKHLIERKFTKKNNIKYSRTKLYNNEYGKQYKKMSNPKFEFNYAKDQLKQRGLRYPTIKQIEQKRLSLKLKRKIYEIQRKFNSSGNNGWINDMLPRFS